MSYKDDDNGTQEAMQAYADNFGIELDDLDRGDFDEAYIGMYDSIEDWAEDFLRETGQLEGLGMLEQYFDYASYASDCETGGDIWTADAPGRRVFVFHNL